VEFISQFFGTIPDAMRALWDLAEGFYGVAITLGSVVIAVGLGLAAAKLRDGHGWLSAAFGMMAGFVAFWWAFGIIPSAFIYFADGNRDLLEGTLFPGALPMMDNAYQVFRDSIVVGLTVIAVVAFSLAAAALQRRYPRTLAEGEEKAPASGGYR
jgi:hypothetical protein